MFGAGVGLGMGYSNCQNDFNSTNPLLYGEYRKVTLLYISSIFYIIVHDGNETSKCCKNTFIKTGITVCFKKIVYTD